MRFLFATTSGTGHLTPMLPFAHALERAGHEVLVAGSGSAGAIARAEGLAFRALGEPVPSELEAVQERLRSLSNDEAPEAAIQDMFVRTYAAAALRDMLPLMKTLAARRRAARVDRVRLLPRGGALRSARRFGSGLRCPQQTRTGSSRSRRPRWTSCASTSACRPIRTRRASARASA